MECVGCDCVIYEWFKGRDRNELKNILDEDVGGIATSDWNTMVTWIEACWGMAWELFHKLNRFALSVRTRTVDSVKQDCNRMQLHEFEGVLWKTTVVPPPGVGNHGIVLLGFTSIPLDPLKPLHPMGPAETCQRASIIFKTQNTPPFFLENGHG